MLSQQDMRYLEYLTSKLSLEGYNTKCINTIIKAEKDKTNELMVNDLISYFPVKNVRVNIDKVEYGFNPLRVKSTIEINRIGGVFDKNSAPEIFEDILTNSISECLKGLKEVFIEKVNKLKPSSTAADTVSGGGSEDTVSGGGSSEDTVSGGSGEDTINSGSSSEDTVSGGEDTISGGDNDTVSGGGDDTITGGDDTVSGGNSDDTVSGGSSDDTISGGNSDDTITGGNSDDTITGGESDDTIQGGSGDDTITGGEEPNP